MDSSVTICYTTIGIDSDKIISITSLRGFFGNSFISIPEFHHHSESSYHYPMIQYKKIGKELILMGISKYAELVFEKLSTIDKILINNKEIPVNNIQIELTKNEIKLLEDTNYRFITPWLALNEKNYKTYLKLATKERKPFLERILVGNILSMLKGLGIRIEFKIDVKISKISSKTTQVHYNKFVGFYCDWNSNILIPKYCGLGKSVSKGYGTVIKNDI
jgi:hypothetical protein